MQVAATYDAPVVDRRGACLACGTVPRDGARFCDNCGAQLESERRAAEYKQVTVLFADVTRSMGIAAAVGSERLREIMADVLDRSTVVVQRYGGTVEKFSGDGIMAMFGAPVALEDHALRACLAALAVQEEAMRMALELAERDGIEFRLRVGLNSGEVVAGDIGSGTLNYGVIGEQVGLGQRMESAAPPGGVMISEATARLVEHVALLGEPQQVAIKNAVDPVPARLLLGVPAEHHHPARQETALVGRARELSTLRLALDQVNAGRGCVVDVTGQPGIGKSRVAREAAALAAADGIDVVWTYCESHLSGVAFHAAAGLLRGLFRVGGLTTRAAREHVRALLPGTDPEDMALLDDLLGCGDDGCVAPSIDPDARRRRLSALFETAVLSRGTPIVYVVEDAHWIDAASEALLGTLVAAAPRTDALVLVTYRPEYAGALRDTSSATRIQLASLDQTQASALTTALLGSHPSLTQLALRIAERAAGNPFFTEEIVRDLVEREVLVGARGTYRCESNADVSVPATVQATIAARIDRLSAVAKRTLAAAAAIGSRFDVDLLAEVVAGGVDITDLVTAELIAQLPTTPTEYVFRHPLMHAVAYESQLKSVRGKLHRRIAAAIERHEPRSVDKNAALIANHLESANDLPDAFAWHMRAGTWSTHRDIGAARASWRRAVAVADRLPTGRGDLLAMRIAPRTLLCATTWQVGGEIADVGFDELRALAAAAGDKRSVVIGMTGLVQMLNFHGEYDEAARLASEFTDLLEAIGDDELTVAMMFAAIVAKWDVGDMAEALRLSERVIDLSDGDPTMGNLVYGSPRALALALRASAKLCVGLPGWRQDFDTALDIARDIDRLTHHSVVMFKYIAIPNWGLIADDVALRVTAELLGDARQFANNFTLTNAKFIHGLVLVHHENGDREEGLRLLAEARNVALDHRYTIVAAWCVDIESATEHIRRGDYDGAIALCRNVLHEEVRSGELLNRGWATTVLVEALLGRGNEGDLDAAQEAVDQLAATPTPPVYLYHELPLLRLRALLAQARGDSAEYRAYRDRYRSRATEFGFEGHIALAASMD